MHRRPILALTVAGVCLAAASSAAEPWYAGPQGTNRVFHVSLTAGLSLGYLVMQSPIKAAIAPETCRWCDPTGLDVRVRDRLVWDELTTAAALSNLTGYVVVPALATGITAIAGLASDDAGWARLIDDTIPILETAAITQTVSFAIKLAVGRQRPYAHYRPHTADDDDNLSFASGHTSLAFSITTSAGMLARWRGSRIEPVIWTTGLTFSVATAYFRIAADKHYATDVIAGCALGTLAGMTVPRLMRRYANLAIVPTRNGVAIAGAF